MKVLVLLGKQTFLVVLDKTAAADVLIPDTYWMSLFHEVIATVTLQLFYSFLLVCLQITRSVVYHAAVVIEVWVVLEYGDW